jgi:regulator of sigma E protease
MVDLAGLMEGMFGLVGAAGGFLAFTVLPFLALIGFIVIVHELGHYALARIGGMTVEEFSIGFGPKLLSRRGRHNLWSLRAIPLGGYVKVPVEGPGSLETASTPAKLGFLIAGPAVNIVFGVALFAIASAAGLGFNTTRIETVGQGGTAASAGLHAGDEVVAVDGIPTHSLREIVIAVTSGPAGGRNTLTVTRTDDPVRRDVVVARGDYRMSFETLKAETPIAALRLGLDQAVALTWSTFTGPFLVSASGGNVATMFAGPVGIAHVTGEVVRGPSPVMAGLQLAAALSISIALFNLLPLPNVDGGRILFAVGEAVTRRKTPIRVQHFLFGASYGALMAGMVVITFHDIVGIIAA